MALPSGTVTFLFTDIEGSTQLLRRAPEGYADALATHRRLLRAAFRAHDGREIDTQGDSFFVAFRPPARRSRPRWTASVRWPRTPGPSG